MREALTIMGHELNLLRRDPKAVILLFIVPVAIISIANFALAGMYGGGLAHAKILLLDEDRSEASQAVTSLLHKAPQLDIVEPADREEALRRVRKGERYAAIVIPEGYSDALEQGEHGEILVLRNTSEVITPRVAYGTLTGIVSRLNAGTVTDRMLDGPMAETAAGQIAARGLKGQINEALNSVWEDPPIQIRQEDVVNVLGGGIDPLKQNVPGFAIMFALFSTLMAGESLLRDKETGAWRRLLAAPVSRAHLLLGKLLASFLVTFLQLVVFFLFGHLVFGMGLGESVAGMLLLCVVLALTTTSLGVLLASLVKTQTQLFGVTTLLILVMSALGGSWWPLEIVPPLMRKLAFGFTINAWAMSGFKDLLWYGRGVGAVLPEAGALLAFAAVAFGVGVWRFRYE